MLPPHQRDAGFELGIVADLDLEAHRKAEATADLAKVVVAGLQHDALDPHALAEIHLHPFHGVLGWRDGAVVAEVGFRVRIRAFLGGTVDALAERGVGFTGCLFQRLLQCGDLVGDLLLLFLQRSELLHGGVVGIKIHVRAVDPGEHGLKRVVVLLADGIELVIMALSALHGEAAEAADGVLHHVIAVQVSRDLAIQLRLRHLCVPDVVPRPRRDESERRDAIRGARIERISGDLLFDEATVRFVVVEGTDDVVSVRPGIHARLVFVIAVCLAVMHEVQPVARPALAVARGGEELIDELLVAFIGQVGPV